MDAELIKSILTVIAAFIPLLVAIIAYLASRPSRAVLTIDRPSLKILEIKRYPLQENVLEKIWSYYFILTMFYLFLTAFIYVVIALFVYVNYSSIFVRLLVFSFLAVCGLTITSIINNSRYRLLFDDTFFKSKNYRYFLFEKADIKIEADYHCLFNKCHDALRKMNYQIVEVNESNRTIEAFRVFFSPQFSFKLYYFQRKDFHLPKRSNYIVTIQIHIEKIENSVKSYQIFLKFTNELDWINNSRETNSFINNLISKPKGADQTAESKVDTTTEVGV